ncbi:hypothetical protein FACS189431_0010 [Alphaproteobacteria bacterium]|nr:hypothetical protein FACS189431_0010 [Alphaproteobacteria bacterium]
MERKPQKKVNMKIIITAVVVIVIAVMATILILQRNEINNLSDPSTSSKAAEKEAAALRDRVAKLMQVPDETPTLATVQDAEKLAGQEFFKDAKTGDKVLIFTNAKKAIIYRESDNKIINSGPIILNSNTVEQATE